MKEHLIVGTGRWAKWLLTRMVECGYEVAVAGRDPSSAQLLAAATGVQDYSLGDLPSKAVAGKVVWLCVSDDAIAPVGEQLLSHFDSIDFIVHSSGTAPLVGSGSVPSAACWPVQSITAETAPDWSNLQLVLEGSTPEAGQLLLSYVSPLIAGPNSTENYLPPKLVSATRERQLLHLAAVLVQNFSNVLWQHAADLLGANELNYTTLLPLMRNYLNKLEDTSPRLLQTGPAMRGDAATVALHRGLLAEEPSLLELYNFMTASIQELR